MAIASRVKDHPVLLLVGAMTASLAALLLFPPLLQDQTYHQFADQRTLFGIPNFWNVVSNVPFIAVGAAGLWKFDRHPITVALFSGMILTGLGSSYYHLNPSDVTLLWDRLPMTICFAAILAVLVQERVNPRAGSLILWLLLAIGMTSVFVWQWTGDLRLYAWAQFFPLLALVLILQFLEPKYTGSFYWIAAIAFYVLAKVFEHFDEEIFSAGLISGHTLKHLAAAAAGFSILLPFSNRRPINRS
jgi:hypothetical protein